MNEFVLPTREQLEFENSRLDLINIADKVLDYQLPWTNKRPSHYAVLLGAYRNHYMLNPIDSRVPVMKGYKEKKYKDHTKYIANIGKMTSLERALSIRPMMEFDDDNEILSNIVFKMKPLRQTDALYCTDDRIGKIEYGYYPNKVASAEMQRVLFDLYDKDLLLKTGNTYTIDLHDIFDYGKPFEPEKIFEYEYEGDRYVLLKAKLKFGEQKMKFNRVYVLDEDLVWVKVEPIEWYASKKNRVIISSIPIISGIPANYANEYLNEYFIHEVTQGFLPRDYKDILFDKRKSLYTYVENINKLYDELRCADLENITYEDTVKYDKLIKRLSNYSS